MQSLIAGFFHLSEYDDVITYIDGLYISNLLTDDVLEDLTSRVQLCVPPQAFLSYEGGDVSIFWR